jgi:hypothetical protein
MSGSAPFESLKKSLWAALALLGDGKFLHYKGSMCESLFWYSGEKHVGVFLHHRIPERNKVVSCHMPRYPSTLPN